MERTIEVPGWAGQWITRDYQPLYYETSAVTCANAVFALIISLKLLWNLRQLRKQAEENPTDRAAAIAKGDKLTRSVLRKQRWLSWMFLLHSQALWLVDAGIGIYLIYSDASADPSAYSTDTWVNLAIYSLGLFILFTSVLIIFPLLQFCLVGRFIGSLQPRATTVGDVVPGVIFLSHQLAYLWLFIGFVMVSWWSVLECSLSRVIILEAVFGSGLAWLHASSFINSSKESLAEVDIHSMNLTHGMRMYGKQIHSVYIANSKPDVLPTYEAVPQSERIVDEKAALL